MSGEHAHGYSGDREAIVKRLHRIEGQVRGIERMVEDDRYCIDILTQIGAVSTALESLAFQILDEHVKHCVAGALASGDEGEIFGEELLDRRGRRAGQVRVEDERPGARVTLVLRVVVLQDGAAVVGRALEADAREDAEAVGQQRGVGEEIGGVDPLGDALGVDGVGPEVGAQVGGGDLEVLRVLLVELPGAAAAHELRLRRVARHD